MKGIVLAGGAGSRLYPVTLAVSKQLVPVYDKPMIYYPLSVLMLAGIRDILIISSPEDLPLYERLLGDGSRLGLTFSYAEQKKPEGIAQAFVIGRDFVGEDPVCLILGDNVFYGRGFTDTVRQCAEIRKGATVFACHVRDPERYGIVEIDRDGKPLSLEEKPEKPMSCFAVPGLYFFGPEVVEMASAVKPGERGELEILDLVKMFLDDEALAVIQLGRGITWLDTGTHRSLLEASNYIEAIEQRQGLKVACLEEIALRNGWVSSTKILSDIEDIGSNSYTDYIRRVVRDGLD